MSKREFELDLTSVCVGSGVIQLPLKMQALFAAGTIPACVDGEDLVLTFIEPRRLSGFKEHFERRGLRGNDKLHFEVAVTAEKAVSLVAASIKRERKQQATKAAVVAQDTATVGPSVEKVAPQHTSSSWGDANGGSQVRAVRRVRIEGRAPQPVSPATQRSNLQPRGVGMGHNGGSTGNPPATNHGGWAPLDGLSPEGEHRQPLHNDYPEATVREVRRSRVGDNQGMDEQQGGREGAWDVAAGEHTVPPLYAQGFEVVDHNAKNADSAPIPAHPDAVTPEARSVAPDQVPLRQATGPTRSPVEASSTNGTTSAEETATVRTPVAAFVPAPRIPVPRNTVAGSTWQPTPASGLNSTGSQEPARQPRLIEETDLAPRLLADYPAARPADAERETNPRGAHERPVFDSPRPAAKMPSRAIDDADFGGEYLPAGRSLEAAVLNHNEVSGRDSSAAPAGTLAREAQGQQQAAPVRLEDDLRMVEAYLDRPDVPAIVRSEVIAAELGIDDQRSERALERLSENRDRVSRIRKGAYMVKRSAQGHSTGVR